MAAKASKIALLVLGLSLLGLGSAWGLRLAPAERYMGEVQRIMYVHVPTAWAAMLCLAAAFAFAVGFLATRRWALDALHEAAIELGVVLSALLCVQGALWARPTWGVWWDWDPRLTTVVVMLFAFLGVLALRRFVEDPVRRAVGSALGTILAFADVPIVYFSVRWWSSLHQAPTPARALDPAMALPLHFNAVGMLLFCTGLLLVRASIASRRLARELAPPAEEPATANPPAGQRRPA